MRVAASLLLLDGDRSQSSRQPLDFLPIGLNLLIAVIILRNTTYLQRAVDRLRNQGMIRHPVIWPIYRHSAGSTSI
jgi:hypothetical protein